MQQRVFFTRDFYRWSFGCCWWSCCSAFFPRRPETDLFFSLSLSLARSRLLYLYLPFRSLFWTLREFHSTNYVTCIIWNKFNLISFNEANPMKTTYIFIKIRDFLRRTSIICWWVSDWMLLFACHQCVFWNRVNHKYATNTPHPFK